MMTKENLLFSLLSFLFFCVAALTTCEASQGEYLNRLRAAKKANKVDYKREFDTEMVDSARALIRQKGSKATDKIERLPGLPNSISFNQYGGYVTVDEHEGRALYYYFAEANGTDPSSKPLVLWLNGGPGCSSLGYGAFTELGPFRVKSDGKTLYQNRFAWNKVANVLFLESPAGVGFSYSNTTSNYDESGDKRTAIDNYVFLVNWLERYPEYKSRDFYISGESYAGYYVPELAHTILKHNKLKNNSIINLKGILIGNGIINEETDAIGMYDYFWTHALISDDTIHNISKYCDFSPNASETQPPQCGAASYEVDVAINDIDIYNIYGPICLDGNVTAKPKRVSITNFDPCSDFYVYAYLNIPEVQKSLHANVTKLTHDWAPCSDVITSWTDSPPSVLNLYREFFTQGLQVWVFSGDNDGRVPVTSTRYSLNLLKLEVKSPWRPWYNRIAEVGGYVVEYKAGLTLVTVRGAGHTVPSYQPSRALTLINFFLKGKPLPSASA